VPASADLKNTLFRGLRIAAVIGNLEERVDHHFFPRPGVNRRPGAIFLQVVALHQICSF